VALTPAAPPDAPVRQRAGDGTLAGITRPIRRELARMERVMEEVAGRSGFLIRPMARHLLRGPGKRIRASLVLFSARAGRADPREAARLAAAVEMLHTASLIHDDILDRAPVRRNQPSLHARWGTHRALLMGDYLLAENFHSLASRFPLEVTRVLLEAARRACEGEIEETGMAFRTDQSERRHLDVIARKTGALMAAACEAGAILGGARPAVRRSLRRYGREFGVAFQLVDDALDFSGDAGLIGKPVGSDIGEGRFTMPVLCLRRILRGGERRRFMRLLRPAALSNGGAREVIDLVRTRGGLACALERAGERLDRALRALDGVPPVARAPLAALAAYALERRR